MNLESYTLVLSLQGGYSVNRLGDVVCSDGTKSILVMTQITGFGQKHSATSLCT